MAALELRFRHFNIQQDLVAYLALFEQVFGKPYTREQFAHKHENSDHHGNAPLIYVVVDKHDKLAGSIAFFPRHLKAQETTHFTVEAGDVMVASTHRGQGLFKQLIEYGREQLRQAGVVFIYGLPNPAAYPGWCRMGFDSHPISQRVRLSSVANILARKWPSLRLVGVLVDVLLTLLPPYPNRALTVSCSQQCGDAAYTEFIAGCYGNKIHQHKNADYLAWRYDTKPDQRYELVAVHYRDEFVGVAIIALRNEALRAEIADFFVKHESDLQHVLAGVVRHYTAHKTVGYITFRKLNTQWHHDRAARCCGFLPVKQQAHIVVQALSPEADMLYELADWHLTGSEMDTV